MASLAAKTRIQVTAIEKARLEWDKVFSKKPDLLEGILAAYSTKGRHYHSVEHIAEMTLLLAEYRGEFAMWEDLLLATLYHDVVYDAQKSDNEERSAARCEAELPQLGIPSMQIRGICELILATKKHQVSSDLNGLKFFLDADLAILGANQARYDRYAADVRKEYAHVPEADYRAGRGAVLKKFLDRPQLYFTDLIRGHDTLARLFAVFLEKFITPQEEIRHMPL
jgi:predicted metal-dependent HD superfamily phosphohydrolase